MGEPLAFRPQKDSLSNVRPLDLEVESVRVGSHDRQGFAAELVESDRKMLGAVTTIFYTWRRIAGFITFLMHGVDALENRLRVQKKRIDDLETRLLALEREKKPALP